MRPLPELLEVPADPVAGQPYALPAQKPRATPSSL
jgi:hypothetical protein